MKHVFDAKGISYERYSNFFYQYQWCGKSPENGNKFDKFRNPFIGTVQKTFPTVWLQSENL